MPTVSNDALPRASEGSTAKVRLFGRAESADSQQGSHLIG